MARFVVYILSFAAVAAATYDQLRDRPFDSFGSQPVVGRSAPAVSFNEASSRSGPVQFSSGAQSSQLASDGSFGTTGFGQQHSGSSQSQQIDSGLFAAGSRFGSQQFITGTSGLGQDQAFGGQLSSFSTGQGSGNVILGSGSAINAPTYEEHLLPRSGPVQVTSTVTNFVTKTHTLRVPATSDVWITSVTMVKVPVTMLTTERNYVRGAADTVTSFVRITSTPVSVATRTAEVFPTKTVVSVFTNFVTETETVELWQPIQHLSTSYDVITRPVLETQTLLQRAFRTVTVTSTIDVTSTRQIVFPRSGRITAPARNYLF